MRAVRAGYLVAETARAGVAGCLAGEAGCLVEATARVAGAVGNDASPTW